MKQTLIIFALMCSMSAAVGQTKPTQNHYLLSYNKGNYIANVTIELMYEPNARDLKLIIGKVSNTDTSGIVILGISKLSKKQYQTFWSSKQHIIKFTGSSHTSTSELH